MRDEADQPGQHSALLLAWYDKHARAMPWRAAPSAKLNGTRPDPYRVWLSEVMLQQTTVAAVQSYFRAFTARWPNVVALAEAEDASVMAEWAGLGYYARARNLLRCARLVAHDLGGQFPTTSEGLQTLPGIGPYTAAAIAAIAYDEPVAVVDGNVERVLSRLYSVQTPLPAAKRELTALAARLTPQTRPGCYAQAMMDLGATICTPRSPTCALCPLSARCRAKSGGIQADLPRRSPKALKPTRLGFTYIGRRTDGAYLIETRPPSGLLGGMLGWPGSDWSDTPTPNPPLAADWRDTGMEVRHTFTHFHLRLTVMAARLPADAQPAHGHFKAPAAFRPADLPTVMRKAYDVAAPILTPIEPISPRR